MNVIFIIVSKKKKKIKWKQSNKFVIIDERKNISKN